MQRIGHIHEGLQHTAPVTSFSIQSSYFSCSILCLLHACLPNSSNIFLPNETSLVSGAPFASTLFKCFVCLFVFINLITVAWERSSATDVRQGGRGSDQFQQDSVYLVQLQACSCPWYMTRMQTLWNFLPYFKKILANYTCSLEFNDFTHFISINVKPFLPI